LEKQCDCSDTNANVTLSYQYICGNPLLGPVQLPTKMPLSNLVDNYRRFGKLCPGEFLKKWYDAQTGWKYPDYPGFENSTAGMSIEGTFELPVGLLVDRFGYENGRFLSPFGTPFNQRAVPPKSLNTPASSPM
jgi:hypothetical protein